MPKAAEPLSLADWLAALLALALVGQVTDQDRFRLRGLMGQVERLDGGVEPLDGLILEATAPSEAESAHLTTIPGLSRGAAGVILAGIGADMTASPTAGPLCWWVGMSPGNHQGAGKRYGGRTTKGSPWLPSMSVPAAWSAGHTSKEWPGATYRRPARRIGKGRAVVAVGRKILKPVYEPQGNQRFSWQWVGNPIQQGP